MRSSPSLRPLALLAALAALSVFVAGCLAQDRPHELTFTVVADAGGAVVSFGDSAHLEWTVEQAVEVEEGGHLAEHPEIEWESSSGGHGSGPNFTVATSAGGLTLVEVNVTAENHSAVDIGGVLAVTGAGPQRAFVGVVGHVELELEGAAFNDEATVVLGSHQGHYYSMAAAGPTVRLRVHVPAEGADASFLLSIKSGAGTGQVNMTRAFAFAGGGNYTLVLDTTSAAAHRIEVRGNANEDISLASLAAAPGPDSEVRVRVAPEGQTLPGMDGVAAVASLAVVVLAVGARRLRAR